MTSPTKSPGVFSSEHGVSPPTSSDSSLGRGYNKEKGADGLVGYDEVVGAAVPTMSKKEEAKLIAQIDLRVLPVLCAMFTLAFLDKVNIANAATFNLSKELKLEGTQYNNCLVVQYIPYLVFEIPSNMMMKKVTPHKWLAGFMFLFGTISMCQGFVHSYGALAATRFLLGCAEVPMFPGSFYIISMWYKRSESLKRFAFFYCSIALSSAFGSLAAYGIGHMGGDAGYAGWRWIFIVEGAVTAFLAIPFYFLIPDFPETSKWLKPEQKAFIKARLASEDGKAALERPMRPKDILDMLLDWKVWAAGFLYLGLAASAYSYSFFSPTIVRQFGISAINTQLYLVGPWAGAWVLGMLTAFTSDRLKRRWIFILLGCLISISGTATLLATSKRKRVNLQYGMMFLFIMGNYMALPVTVCWFSMNLVGHHRRAVGTAFQIGIGQVGGIIAVYTFIQKDAPRYLKGYGLCVALNGFAMVMATAYAAGCWFDNKRKDKIARSQGGEGVLAVADTADKQEKEELGDRALEHRYMI